MALPRPPKTATTTCSGGVGKTGPLTGIKPFRGPTQSIDAMVQISHDRSKQLGAANAHVGRDSSHGS